MSGNPAVELPATSVMIEVIDGLWSKDVEMELVECLVVVAAGEHSCRIYSSVFRDETRAVTGMRRKSSWQMA